MREWEIFDKRANGYEEHMKENIECFEKCYTGISNPINKTAEKINILELGCGTGLEIEGIFLKASNAKITGIDMSEEMLNKLKTQYESKSDHLKCFI